MDETDRILALPKRTYKPLKADTERRLFLKPRAVAEGVRLLPAQSIGLRAALHAFEAKPGPDGLRGGLGPLNCGTGKSVLIQCIASLAVRQFGVRRPLLILPSSLQRELKDERAKWRPYFKIGARPRMLTYGALSHPSYQTFLDDYRPDLILMDEAHLIGKETGVRIGRLDRYITENYNSVRLFAYTGSLFRATVRTVAHLSWLALRDWSPLPIDNTILSWQAMLDVGGEPSAEDANAYQPVINWAREKAPRKMSWSGFNRREVARRAFAKRFRTAPGVVFAADLFGLPTSLSIRFVRPWVSKWSKELDETWTLPDGTELVDAFEYNRHRRTVGLGFYYELTEMPEEWTAARKLWAGAVRALVEYGDFESPYFVDQAAEAGRLGKGHLKARDRWLMQRKRYGLPESRIRWLDRSVLRRLVDAFVDPVREREEWRSLVYYQSRGVARWAQRAKYPVFGAGSIPPRKGAAPFAFIGQRPHGQGWNGQAYHRALMLEPPGSADHLEQLLARQHRTGQENDVEVWVYASQETEQKLRVAAEFVQPHAPQRWLTATRKGEISVF